MARAAANWERLVRAALQMWGWGPTSPGASSSSSRYVTGITPNEPYFFGNANASGGHIQEVLRVADVIGDEDPHVACILSGYAYKLAQTLDPGSDSAGVLQFRAGLMAVMKYKSYRGDNPSTVPQEAVRCLVNFCHMHRERHKLDELPENEKRLRESNLFNANLRELEHEAAKQREVLASLKVIQIVARYLAEEITQVNEEDEISKECKNLMKQHNIIPLDYISDVNSILSFSEVRAAIYSLQNFRDLPALPNSFLGHDLRNADMIDFLHFVFGFQNDNMRNQREHIVHLLSNQQSQLGRLPFNELKIADGVVSFLFDKTLDNYFKWCEHLLIQPFSNNVKLMTKEWKLLYICLYFLIWGEAANIRFLPEGLCYIFHNMATEVMEIVHHPTARYAVSCETENAPSFLDKIITPLYDVIATEARNSKNGRTSHSSWRNYDDFNEFFWSPHCFELGWPVKLSHPFFMKPRKENMCFGMSRSRHYGKMFFVEHRIFLHLYHSFHRLWIFLIVSFQALTIIAFNNGKINGKTLEEVLSIFPTYVVMKLLQSLLDIWTRYGAITTSGHSAVVKVVYRVCFFSVASLIICLLYVKGVEQGRSSAVYRLYVFAAVAYTLVQLFMGLLQRFPCCLTLTRQCRHWYIVRLLMQLHQENIFVGQGLYVRQLDYLKYVGFWVILLSFKFSFSYFLQIKPLVGPTKTIVHFNDLSYAWHDFISKNNHNALTILTLWAPVVSIYLLDIYVFYTLLSAIWGFLLGAKQRLGEIKTMSELKIFFATYPGVFMKNLHIEVQKRKYLKSLEKVTGLNKFDASIFTPFWNEIIKNLREEDYISNHEMELLVMPKSCNKFSVVQWPLFLLVNKVPLAIKVSKKSAKHGDSQEELWEDILRDEYMKRAIQECFYLTRYILMSVLQDEGATWVELMCESVEECIKGGMIMQNMNFSKLKVARATLTEIIEILKENETTEQKDKVMDALYNLYKIVSHGLLVFDKSPKSSKWSEIDQAREDGTLFSSFRWPSSSELIKLIKRLGLILEFKKNVAGVPKNLEARRRLTFFSNSLFMQMPPAVPVSQMLSFSVFTPYFDETVLYGAKELTKENEDGISTLFYLKTIYPDEWINFQERIRTSKETQDTKLFHEKENEGSYMLDVRFWASYRGQTLARTIRGMMYYRKAIMLQSFVERRFPEGGDLIDTQGYECCQEGEALADLKFTYVVSCQKYGKQKHSKDEEEKEKAADIALLLQRNNGLRIAYINEVEGNLGKEFYSKLIKADEKGAEKEIYSIKLPGNPLLGEGKPENQNHAIIFTRGNAIQTIDMNQDNYFEEALKVRNLLEEFGQKDGKDKVTILGLREHVFTGSVSSLAALMSHQETSFVTLGQRVLANPLKVRMHYGHPDVFDRIFHISRGGISKASKTINVSEDIYAGFNSTLRKGNITHHEYTQIGKGRDVGFNQIATFEKKVSSGNGEQALSRDVYRLGQLLDFFRMMSFFVTTVGYYFCTMLTVLTVYVFLYGKTYLALSGVGAQIGDRSDILGNTSLNAALNTQFLIQIGVFTAVPMILGFILEHGPLLAFVSFVTMQVQLCSVFFTFSLGTRAHYFGRTMLHGGAGYKATGRGFNIQHSKFSENYRLYSRSHFIKGFEVILLLMIFLSYGFNSGGTVGYFLLSISSWFMALSWLCAPFIFNPSAFEWQKTLEDFTDWTNWLFYKGGIGVEPKDSWEAWWDFEVAHIQTLGGRLFETVLCLRFFIFQYGIVYQLQASKGSTSLAVYGFSWAVLAALVLVLVVFGFNHRSLVHFQMFHRLIKATVTFVILVCLSVALVFTSLSIGDIFACTLAYMPTIWGVLSIAVAWKPLMKRLHIWKSVRAVAWVYDVVIGFLIFIPIVACSWLPFLSTFQTRMLFNQAFSRGLEISLILSGQKEDKQEEDNDDEKKKSKDEQRGAKGLVV